MNDNNDNRIQNGVNLEESEPTEIFQLEPTEVQQPDFQYQEQYYKKPSFIPKIILVLVILLIIAISAIVIYSKPKSKPKSNPDTVQEIKEDDTNYKTVEDFKNELISRNLYNGDSGLYGEGSLNLLGVTQNPNKKNQSLKFTDNDKKYSSYIYYGAKTTVVIRYNSYTGSDEYTENNVSYPWIIYYIDGKIYASIVKAKSFFAGYNIIDGEIYAAPAKVDPNNDKYIYEVAGKLLTESNEVYGYNSNSNKLETINVDDTKKCLGHKDMTINDDDISKMDYLSIYDSKDKKNKSCMKFKKVDKINDESIHEYTENYINKNN